MLKKSKMEHTYIYIPRIYNITYLNTVFMEQKILYACGLTITCQNSHSLHERESLD